VPVTPRAHIEVRTSVLPVRKSGIAEYLTSGDSRAGWVGCAARASL
jgi:hypothetical protein